MITKIPRNRRKAISVMLFCLAFVIHIRPTASPTLAAIAKNRGDRDAFVLNFNPLTPQSIPSLDRRIFEGRSNSLVAKAVGSAEGTRTPDGGKTWAYYGHADPGNGKWNLGSFSYQHGASSPEEADRKQLARLEKQLAAILELARQQELNLSLEEKLNVIDLANQAPLAALDTGGFIDRLKEAKSKGSPDPILDARTYSFINPRTNRWDAAGLGNTERTIRADQNRRREQIKQAIAASQ